MAGRLLKAEGDRALAANRGTAVEVHLRMDFQHCLHSAPPDGQKNPLEKEDHLPEDKKKEWEMDTSKHMHKHLQKKRTLKSTHTLHRQNPPPPWAVSLFCPRVGLTGTAGSRDTTLSSETWHNSWAGSCGSKGLADSS